MPKRRRSQSPERPPQDRRPLPRPSKRARLIPSRLLTLPQELLLRILYQLRPATLLTLSLTSKKLHSLASDPQIWKALFWRRFVQPYVTRFGSLVSPSYRPPSEATSLREWRLWLDDAELLQKEREVVAKHEAAAASSGGPAFLVEDVGSYNADVPPKPKVVGMDWKSKYRLRHNWARGACKFGEVMLEKKTEQGSATGSAVTYHEGYAFTAGKDSGLQIWDVGKNRGTEPSLVCQHKFDLRLGTPTCVAIDEIVCDDYLSGLRRVEGVEVVVGFDASAFALLNFRIDTITNKAHLTPIMQTRTPDSNKLPVKLVAYAQGYLCIMTTKPELFVYHVPIIRRFDGGVEPPRIKLVTSLKCDYSWMPTALSVRNSDGIKPRIVATVVFAVGSLVESVDGLCMQELHIDPVTRKLLETRVASSSSPTFLDINYIQPALGVSHTSPPTSTVYRYPFLMTSHGDNTLTRYLVSSSEDELVLAPGYRMWGHTAAVSGVAIRRRKAVSVDRRGEILVWDLQDLQRTVKVKRTLPRDGDDEHGGSKVAVPTVRTGGFIAFGEDEIVLVENGQSLKEEEEEEKGEDEGDSSIRSLRRLLVCNFT